MEADRLLEGLDAAQRRAVTCTSHPLAILAGAGSGKTRVLTRRIAYRCLVGDADPRHVVAVTFTRKAANELDARLRTIGLRDLPSVGTFHALAFAQLQPLWTRRSGGVPKVLDRKVSMVARILGGTRRATAAEVASEIDWARARLVTPERYPEVALAHGRRLSVDPVRIAEWMRRYEQEKRRRGVVDFDDMLAEAAQQMELDPSHAAAQRWRYRHLFVDEYQDVNPLQERLLRAWLGDRVDLCVVGDPNQAIYGWNGADSHHLRDFTRRHPGATVLELTDSYRSSPQVLAVAAGALGGSRPSAASHRRDGPVPVVVGYHSDVDEANGIARAVRDNHPPGRPWSAQAILVRTNAQTEVIERALRVAGIPYRLKGAHPLLADEDVKDLLVRLERLTEPLKTTIDDLEAAITASPIGAGADDGDGSSRSATDATSGESATSRRAAAFAEVVNLGREYLLIDPNATTSSFPLWARAVLGDEGLDRGDAVTIASFHAAKGLEWDVVHVAGLEDGYVPIVHARTDEALEEEARLLYVALTRASEVLRCSWAASRTFGDTVLRRRPSPFIERIRSTVGELERAASPTVDTGSRIMASRAALGNDPAADESAQLRRIETALRRWRDEQARRARVLPTVVLGDNAVKAIALARPRDIDALCRVSGMGPIASGRHGERLLAVLSGVLDEEQPVDRPER